MKTSRLAVLGVAIVTGGGAAFLAGRSEAPPPAPPPPVVTVDTVDVLVALMDINIGQTIAAADMRWVACPPAPANSIYMRRADGAGAVEQLAGAIARVP